MACPVGKLRYASKVSGWDEQCGGQGTFRELSDFLADSGFVSLYVSGFIAEERSGGARGLDEKPGLSRTRLGEFKFVSRAGRRKRQHAERPRIRRMQIDPSGRRIDIPAFAFGFAEQLRVAQVTAFGDNSTGGVSEHGFAIAGIDCVGEYMDALSGKLEWAGARLEPNGTTIFIGSKGRV